MQRVPYDYPQSSGYPCAHFERKGPLTILRKIYLASKVLRFMGTYRFLAIFFLFLGGFFIIFAFHAPPELEGPPSFFLAMMCLALSLFFETSNPQQPKIDKTKLGEPTKSETNTQINPFTLILVGISILLFLFFCFFFLPVLIFILSHSS